MPSHFTDPPRTLGEKLLRCRGFTKAGPRCRHSKNFTREHCPKAWFCFSHLDQAGERKDAKKVTFDLSYSDESASEVSSSEEEGFSSSSSSSYSSEDYSSDEASSPVGLAAKRAKLGKLADQVDAIAPGARKDIVKLFSKLTVDDDSFDNESRKHRLKQEREKQRQRKLAERQEKEKAKLKRDRLRMKELKQKEQEKKEKKQRKEEEKKERRRNEKRRTKR
ncbi:hypothetical protein SLS60_007545 [Paraconiothyrium brasiliense]|uniref:Uncharacterized protein n=1 Tax=Paraconiothyrium brasiliense TaxID=300254 RepID=A0ABR3R5M3_9PLEO